MFFLRYLVLIFIISYVYWYINTHFFNKNLALTQVIAYTLIIVSIIGSILWGLSFLIEGH